MTTNNNNQIYELTILIDENATDEDIKATAEMVKRYGKIIKTEDEGVKNLCYRLRGHDKARYLFYTLTLDVSVQNFCDNMSINENIIRYLLVRCDMNKYNRGDK